MVPEEWHLSRVTALFKKGDWGDCGNYRPISLVCVVYKLFANVLLKRLKAAGAEQKIWSTQYGFKSKHGAAEVLILVRRTIEQVFEREDELLILLALDWAKVFGSLSL